MNSDQLKSSKGSLLEGPLLLTPKKFNDERGFLYESWNQDQLDALTESKKIFKQDNHSRSSLGVLRGLHYQLPPFQQEKLVRCTYGKIFDVVVDIRRSSPSYRHWAGVELDDNKNQQLWVPMGFAHGFLTLIEGSEVQYKVTHYWNKEFERSIRWDDQNIQIEWPFDRTNQIKPRLSKKDAEANTLKDAELLGDIFL